MGYVNVFEYSVMKSKYPLGMYNASLVINNCSCLENRLNNNNSSILMIDICLALISTSTAARWLESVEGELHPPLEGLQYSWFSELVTYLKKNTHSILVCWLWGKRYNHYKTPHHRMLTYMEHLYGYLLDLCMYQEHTNDPRRWWHQYP